MTNASPFAADLSADLALALEAAKKAGEIALSYWHAGVEVERKKVVPGGDATVTIADREIDDFLNDFFKTRCPNDGLLTEETEDDLTRLEKARVWIIDPIDGTREFARHSPDFGVSIALVEHHRPVVGVIYLPATNEMFHAETDGPVFKNGTPCPPWPGPDAPSYEKSTCLLSPFDAQRSNMEKAQPLAPRFTPVGSAVCKMVRAAVGDADMVALHHALSEWDIAAGTLICKRAGLMVCHGPNPDILFNQENTRLENGLWVAPPPYLQQLQKDVSTILPHVDQDGYFKSKI